MNNLHPAAIEVINDAINNHSKIIDNLVKEDHILTEKLLKCRADLKDHQIKRNALQNSLCFNKQEILPIIQTRLDTHWFVTVENTISILKEAKAYNHSTGLSVRQIFERYVEKGAYLSIHNVYSHMKYILGYSGKAKGIITHNNYSHNRKYWLIKQ